MKTQRQDFSTLEQDNNLKSRTNVLESDEERILNYSTLSNYGPCCTGGCQYCRPNCHEKTDGLDYF